MGGKRRKKHCPAAQCRLQEKNYCKRQHKPEEKPQEKKAPHWRKRQDTKCKRKTAKERTHSRKALYCTTVNGSTSRKIKNAREKAQTGSDRKRHNSNKTEHSARYWCKWWGTKCKRKKAPHCTIVSGTTNRKIKTAQQKSFILHDRKRQRKPQEKSRKIKAAAEKRCTDADPASNRIKKNLTKPKLML